MSTDLELYTAPKRPVGRPRKVKTEIDLSEYPDDPDLLPVTTEPRERVVKAGAKKFSAWEERQIMHDLLEMPTVGEVMEKWGFSKSYLQEFRKRNSHAIQELLDRSDDAYAGLWAAKKEARIAALQDRAENLAKGTEGTRIFIQVMHEISEQLGQTPPKNAVVMTNPVVHVYQGIDVDQV